MSESLKILLSNRTKSILQQVLIWTFIYLAYSYIRGTYGYYSKSHIVNLLNVPLFMAAYYSLKYVQIPRFYAKGKLAIFALSLLGSSLFIFGVFSIGRLYLLNYPVDQGLKSSFITIHSYMLLTVRFYSPALAVLAWDSHAERRKELKRIKQLETEKLATELKFLKAQINPHFLFNTLNNLYSYVVTESPKAPDMIVRLTGILDYVLYKSQNKTVALSEEVETIQNFLGLEQIRYGDRLQVDYKTDGNLSTPISPLILLSIVENAFKHGASGDIEQPKIKIEISSKDDVIHCKVWNTKTQYAGELNDEYKKGIGLSNIKRQLDLIYPDLHELVIENEERTFNVELTIRQHEIL